MWVFSKQFQFFRFALVWKKVLGWFHHTHPLKKIAPPLLLFLLVCMAFNVQRK